MQDKNVSRVRIEDSSKVFFVTESINMFTVFECVSFYQHYFLVSKNLKKDKSRMNRGLSAENTVDIDDAE